MLPWIQPNESMFQYHVCLICCHGYSLMNQCSSMIYACVLPWLLPNDSMLHNDVWVTCCHGYSIMSPCSSIMYAWHVTMVTAYWVHIPVWCMSGMLPWLFPNESVFQYDVCLTCYHNYSLMSPRSSIDIYLRGRISCTLLHLTWHSWYELLINGSQ